MMYKLNLHGYSKDEAKYEIISLLNSLPSSYTGIEVNHGYNRGTVIRDMIRNKEIKHKRFGRYFVPLNDGITEIMFK